MSIKNKIKEQFEKKVAPGQIDILDFEQDITEGLKIEKNLALQKEVLQNIIDNVPVYIICFNADKKIQFINQEFQNRFGWTSLEAQKMDIFKHIFSNTVNQGLLENSKNQQVNIKNTTRSGSKIEVSWQVIKNSNGSLLAIGLDISEKKQIEYEKQKNHNLKSLGVLAGGIAHDFNNILTGILVNISYSKFKLDSGNAARSALTQAEQAVMKATNLTRQLLTFAKGGVPIKTNLSTVKLLKDTVESSLRGSNVKCTFDFVDDLWSLNVDEIQINQVFNNLIINADQAMPEGGNIHITAENILLSKQEKQDLDPGKYVKITIADQGKGISKKYIQQIFDPYFTTKDRGSGLGLSICYSVIKKHNGYIGVSSVENRGTTFELYLPATISNKKLKPRPRSKKTQTTGKLLIMEDDSIIRQSLYQSLKDFGYNVITAKSGVECISLYKQFKQLGMPFDYVLLDMTVPGAMGGKEAAAKILEFDPRATLIIATGYANDPILKSFKKFGFAASLSKPYTIEELRGLLSSLK